WHAPGAQRPYGRLPKAAPPILDATPRSEAQPAKTGPRLADRLAPVHLHRPAARLHGGPRAPGLCRNLHRAAPAVLATLASGHPQGHRRRPRVRGDPWIPHVPEGSVHGIPDRGDRGTGNGAQSGRGSDYGAKPGSRGFSDVSTEPPAASRDATPDSDPVTRNRLDRTDTAGPQAPVTLSRNLSPRSRSRCRCLRRCGRIAPE